MQVDVFKVFCDLVETSSFSKAAAINSITQSAVSQQIRALETRYQVTLIKRGGRNFALTPEGAAFLETSKEILDIYNHLEDRIHELRNVVEGELKIAALFSIGLHELPPLLKKFRAQYPDVEVEVEYRNSAQVYSQVLDGDADIGLVAYPQKRKGIVIEPFTDSKQVLIVSPHHPFAKLTTVPAHDLAGEKYIAYHADLPIRKVLDRYLKDHDADVDVVHEFDNIETLKRAVEIEQGISIVPRSSVEEDVKSGALVALEITPEIKWTLGILLRNNRSRTPAQREFIKILQEAAEVQ